MLISKSANIAKILIENMELKKERKKRRNLELHILPDKRIRACLKFAYSYDNRNTASDGEDSVQDFWEMWNSPSLHLFPGTL